MDQTTPLPLQAYGSISSAAKQQNHFMFNFDQTAIKNMNTVGGNTAGKPQLPPFSAQGNEKFEWGQELNGGAIPSPNIFQHKGFAYTPIMTSAAYSSLAKGQNYFNFANAASIDEQSTMQQMHNAANTNAANGAAFGTTPQQILYGENMNLYGNTPFNNNNIQAAVTANSLMQPQQQNYATAAAAANGAINPLVQPKINDEASTPFQMENAFQFSNFNGQGVNNQNSNGKNTNTSIIGVGSNSKPGQNGVPNQNSPNDYLSHQMKLQQNGVPQPSQFMPQQQQFPSQQSQQGQQPQQAQQQQQPGQQQHQQQQFQNYQKNQFLNNPFNSFNNPPGDQQFQGEAGLNMNQLQAAAVANGATNPQQLAAAVAAAGNSTERKKPQPQLSLQIPQGNSINNNTNQNGPQTNTTNPATANPNANGPLNTTEGNGFYFQSYNNIGLAPFTPIGPTTMGLQPLNGAPPSSHLPPFTQRTGNQPYDNFFFNAQTNIQQIPDQYQLLTPGNTGYNKQQFFYPASGADQTAGPSQFMPQQYAAQHPAQTPSHHPNNPQHLQQHPHQFPPQQQQQQQQAQFQQHQQQNPQQQQHSQLMHQQAQGFGLEQQQQANTEKNDQKKKNLNLKLDVSMKDNNFGIIPSFERGSSGDQKKGLLNFGSGIIDSASKVNGQNDEDKDKNIMSMLQKNNPQNNMTSSSYLDAANMSLIIDFYQKANPEKKQQLYDFLSNQQNDDKDDNQKNKSQKIIEYIITANTKRIGTLTLQQRMEKIQRYREKRQRRANTSLVKYKKQQIAVSKKPRDKNGKFLKQLDEEILSKKKIKKK